MRQSKKSAMELRDSMLKVYSHTDAEAKPLLRQVSKYIELANMLNLPFWIFAEDSNPLGIVTIGNEPIQLLAPIGTPIAIIDLVQQNSCTSVLRTFAAQSLKLALEKEARIATVELLSGEKDAIASFLESDFCVLADSFMMSHQLDQEYTPNERLQFTLVKKDELWKWIEMTTNFLSGSKDVVAERKIKNLGRLPEHVLAIYYSMEAFYFVNEGEQKIGILNFNPTAGRISNVGVDPPRRSEGYGRQIMLFGLQQLKAAGCTQAKLGVHIDNEPTLNLYKSLGFEVNERRKLLIWENQKAHYF